MLFYQNIKMPDKKFLPKEQIIKLYKQNFTTKQIAKAVQCEKTLICTKLKRWGVLKPYKFTKTPYEVYLKLSDKQYFTQKFQELRSKNKLRKFFGCGIQLIDSLCDEYKLEIFSQRDMNFIKNITKEKIEELFYKKYYTKNDIRNYFNCSNSYFSSWCRDNHLTLTLKVLRI